MGNAADGEPFRTALLAAPSSGADPLDVDAKRCPDPDPSATVSNHDIPVTHESAPVLVADRLTAYP